MRLKIPNNIAVYSGCGNRFLILPIDTEKEFFSLQKNMQVLASLAHIAKKHSVDSVMIIVGNPHEYMSQGYHVKMYVFEPNAFREDLPSDCWSTMCGNGIRAVAAYLFTHEIATPVYQIKTLAGIHTIVKQGDEWRVDMGYFVRDRVDLASYVSSDILLTTRLFNISSREIEPTIYVGFHTFSTTHKDGEPHAVLFTKTNKSHRWLHRMAKKMGSSITTNKVIFPKEINTTIASIINIRHDENIVEVGIATYERHIYYVTKACGTAATVVGSLLFEQLQLSDDWKIIVHAPGGRLCIEKNSSNIYSLTGEATNESEK